MSSTPTKPVKGPLDGAFDALASIKLSIFVLIAIAATSIFGTVIQQGKDLSVYVQEYGEGVARLIVALNLGDMYHSWWFQLLLVLLLVNITFCSVKRLPQALRLMRDREPVFDGRPVAIHQKWQKVLKGHSVEEVSAKVEGLLADKLARPLRREVDGTVYLFATRGGWARMGVYVTHASLFLFALGGLIGAQWGFKGFVNIPEGESITSVGLRSGGEKQLDFEVRCDRFEVQFYPDESGRPTGRPKEYLSELTVREGGREVVKKRIEVNDPLIHQGIYFYQSSYGQVAGRGATVSVLGPRRNQVAVRQSIDRGGRMPLEEGAHLVLREISADFRNMGPAAEFVVERPGVAPESVVVFQAPQGNNRPLGGYILRLEAVDSVKYTGLQVAYDPGVPAIWAGCILMTVGSLVAIFLSHRRVWARVQRAEGGVQVFLGGNASRNPIAFERWFGDLAETANETFEK